MNNQLHNLLSQVYGEDPVHYAYMGESELAHLQRRLYKGWKPDLPPTRPFNELRMDEIATMSEVLVWMNNAGWRLEGFNSAKRVLKNLGIEGRSLVRYLVVQIDQLACIPVVIPDLWEQPIAIDRLVSAKVAAGIAGVHVQTLFKRMTAQYNPIVGVTLRDSTDVMYVTEADGLSLMTIDMHDEYYRLVAEQYLEIE